MQRDCKPYNYEEIQNNNKETQNDKQHIWFFFCECVSGILTGLGPTLERRGGFCWFVPKGPLSHNLSMLPTGCIE